MALFKYEQLINNPDNERFDLTLLMFGPISQYFNTKILEQDITKLEKLGYRMIYFNCLQWHSIDDLHNEFYHLLSFPKHSGFDPLYSLLREMEIFEPGLCFILTRFDDFALRFREDAQITLNILVKSSHFHQLFGRTILTLIQSNDPWLHFESVGGLTIYWNPQEFLNSKRGV